MVNVFLIISVIIVEEYMHAYTKITISHATKTQALYFLVCTLISGWIIYHSPTKISIICPIYTFIAMVTLSNAAIDAEEFKVHEYLASTISFQFLVIILLPNHFISSCLAFTAGVLYMVGAVHYSFDEVPSSFNVSMLATLLFYYVARYVVNLRFNELFETIIRIEQLIKQSKRVMQIFPQGIIIESKGDLKSKKVMYSNDSFNNQIKNIRNKIEQLKNIEVSIKNIKENSMQDQEFKTDLHSYFRIQQNALIREGKTQIEQTGVTVSCCSNMDIAEELSTDQQVSQKIFNIKSIEIVWEDKPCLMHVFSDTTDLLKLEEANTNIRCQRIMFTSVSHELRTPLNGVINFYALIEQRFEAMLKGNDKNEHLKLTEVNESFKFIKKYIKLGLCSSKQLLYRIEDILDLSKFESGIFTFNTTEFEVCDLFKEVLNIFECQCDLKQIKLTTSIDPRLDSMHLLSDSGRIRQVLLNLASNSFKFTSPKGSISISAEYS